MRRELYKRWRNHPLRGILRRAQQGEHIYPDELDDLNLPDKVRKAAEQAIERCREEGAASDGLGGRADRLSPALVDALPEHHETREQHQQRRADLGDHEAHQAVRGREQAIEAMANDIHRRAHQGRVASKGPTI